MNWKNQDTIKVYEHYFDKEKHREAHDCMLESMEKKEQDYVAEQKSKRKNKPQLTLLRTTNELKIDLDLQELFEGLE